MASTPEDIGNELKHLALSELNVKLLRDQNLGRGAYGTVFKAQYYESLCAAKEIHTLLIETACTEEQQKVKENFIRECCHCSKFNHPNIVKFIGIIQPPRQLLPVMIIELMDQSLTNYAKKQDLSFKTKISILLDVANGLSYLHSYSVIHRDLSPNNVLLKVEPLYPVAKIADLGVAKILSADESNSRKYLTTMPGAIDFMAPEMYANRVKYGTSLDVFSYGGIMLHTVNGVWPTPTELTRYDTITCKNKAVDEVERRQEHLDKMIGETKLLRPLVESCLDNDPNKRPSIDQLSKRIKVYNITTNCSWLHIRSCYC